MTRSTCLTLRVLLIAAALLMAQWVLVQHEVQIEAHAAHTGCEWCLTHAPLGGGPAASAVSIPVVAQATATVEPRNSPFVPIVLPACPARAPPAVLPA